MIKKPLVLLIALSTGFLVSSCNFPYQPKQFVIPPPNYIFPSKTEMMNFTGNSSANIKLAFTIKNSFRDVYYIDYNNYNDSAFFPMKLKKPKGMENYHADSPLISPDGSFVAYYLTAGATVNGAYIQRLDTASSPVLIDAKGTEPHWWQEDNTGLYIIYSNVMMVDLNNLKKGIGQTFKQKVILTGDGSISGAAQIIAPYPMNGGLSTNGQYLCTGYQNSAFYNLSDSSLIPINATNQTCNPSTDPDSAKPGWMMFLNFGGKQNMDNPFIGNTDFPDSSVAEHTVLYIVDYTNTVRDYITLGQLNAAYSGYAEWQDPEWSNDPRFAAALALVVIDGAQADGIIVKNVGDPAAKKAFLKFTLGKGKLDATSTPYIWIGK
jgi:hypothetical protein